MVSSVMISPDEKRLGKDIPDERKKIIYRAYKKYGNINDHKLNELLHSYNSPLCVDENPVMLAYIMANNIVFKDEKLALWYREFVKEFDNENE